MTTAQIFKSMKVAPQLDKSTYNRWSKYFRDVLSLFDVDSFILETKNELKTRNDKSASDSDKIIHKQDKNIRIAISQLVPDVVFHNFDCTYTAKQCWDNLKEFYFPNSAEDIDDLLQEFWGLTIEDDVDIDEFVQKLTEIRAKINLIDSGSTPSNKSMKKRVLIHFIKCCGRFFMSTTISLKDPAVTFQATVTSIRESQLVYRELHPTPIIAFMNSSKTENLSPSSQSDGNKKCAYCNRRGHLRESCFNWLEIPDGSKWSAKNPKKAAKTLKLKEKLSRGKGKAKKNSKNDSSIKTKIDDDTKHGA
ncbi:hypothetical protein EV44_g3362 [Erysiphe necator]|uniref:CCHC-type domain-containing protein n=1 Tax=Uncinula necator TaxID=52586 RepID=A0A0B1P3D5_UNCNE|nr:hypothetical protein EV44_g3362 [Erysiphe necator]